MEYNFKKVHTGKDLAISTIVLLAGVGLFFVNKGLGICIAVCGLFMFLFCKGGYKKDGQGVVLQKKSEDLCKCCKSSIADYLAGKDLLLKSRRETKAGASVLMYITTLRQGLHMRNCMISGTIPMSRKQISSNSIPQRRTS